MTRPPSEAVTPQTRKGRRAQSSLILAARRVFESRGFYDTRMSDIADEAGVAYGTAYRYFTSKEELFREVALSIQEEMLQYSLRHRPPAGISPYERIRHENRVFLESYRDNAAIIAVIDQVAASNSTMREMRKAARETFVLRTVRGLRHLQADGLAYDDVDPHYAANVLGSMVDRFAFIWFSLGEEFDLDTAVDTLSKLWARAIGLSIDGGDRADDGGA